MGIIDDVAPTTGAAECADHRGIVMTAGGDIVLDRRSARRLDPRPDAMRRGGRLLPFAEYRGVSAGNPAPGDPARQDAPPNELRPVVAETPNCRQMRQWFGSVGSMDV